MPVSPITEIDVVRLDSKIESLKEQMTSHQYNRCKKAVDYLSNGAPSFQMSDLPSCFVKMLHVLLNMDVRSLKP